MPESLIDVMRRLVFWRSTYLISYCICILVWNCFCIGLFFYFYLYHTDSTENTTCEETGCCTMQSHYSKLCCKNSGDYCWFNLFAPQKEFRRDLSERVIFQRCRTHMLTKEKSECSHSLSREQLLSAVSGSEPIFKCLLLVGCVTLLSFIFALRQDFCLKSYSQDRRRDGSNQQLFVWKANLLTTDPTCPVMLATAFLFVYLLVTLSNFNSVSLNTIYYASVTHILEGTGVCVCSLTCTKWKKPE